MVENIGRITQYFESRRKEMEDFLCRLIEIESPSRDPESQFQIINHLISEFDSIGYKCERFYGKQTGGYMTAAHKHRKKNAPFQLLVGHCDTVWNKGTLKEMPIIIHDNKIKGPGVFDMKAGLTQMIFAIRALKELNITPEVEPFCFINSDEEIGSRESTPALKKLSKIADRAYVIEPPLGPTGALKTARKGVGRFTLKIKGIAAHAGLNPEEGSSAILELSHQIQRLFALNDPNRGITVNVGMIEGGISTNVVAPFSSAVADVRVRTAEDAEYVTHKIMSIKPIDPRVEIKIEGGIGRPPMEMNKQNRILWEAAFNTGKLMDLHLEHAAAGGGSDANTTSQLTPTLDGLGTTGGGAHANHEFILSDKLMERTGLLTLLLLLPPITKLKMSYE